MAAVRFDWQNIKQYIWLISGLLSLIFAFVFWLVTDTKDLVTIENPIEEAQTQIQPEKVAATAHLGSLMDEVRPLEMTTRVVASGNHESEFKGTKFFQDNKKASTIELFKATNEDVIKSFLLKQTDRKNFIYFRLSGEKQAEQYVLGYGVFKNDDQAKAQLQNLKLNLPASVKPAPVQLEKYAALINDLGSDELAGSNKLYEIKLRTVALPVIDESVLAQQTKVAPKPTVTVDPNKATTSTTITKKNEQGEVVDVKRSQTAVEPTVSKPKETKTTNTTSERKSTEHEISDPFN